MAGALQNFWVWTRDGLGQISGYSSGYRCISDKLKHVQNHTSDTLNTENHPKPYHTIHWNRISSQSIGNSGGPNCILIVGEVVCHILHLLITANLFGNGDRFLYFYKPT